MTVFTVFCITYVWIRDGQATLQCEYQHGHFGSWLPGGHWWPHRVGRAEARWQQAEDVEDANMNPSRQRGWWWQIDRWGPKKGCVNPEHRWLLGKSCRIASMYPWLAEVKEIPQKTLTLLFIYLQLFDTKFHCAAQAGLELVAVDNLPTSASWVLGLHMCTRVTLFFTKL